MKNNLTLQVLSSLTKETGTFIVDEQELIEKEIASLKGSKVDIVVHPSTATLNHHVTTYLMPSKTSPPRCAWVNPAGQINNVPCFGCILL